jgi:hypothetical protein
MSLLPSPRRPHLIGHRTAIVAACAAAVVAYAGTPVASQTPPAPATAVAGTSGAWVIEGADRADDVKVAPFLGRDALWLRNGTQALRAAPDMADGTIEFDVAPMDRCDFVALVFRRQSHAAGGVGVWARVNNAPGEWAAAISNVRVTPVAPAPRAPAPPPPPGFLARWEVSAPVADAATPVRAIPDATGWAPVVAEDSGLVNLSRVFKAQRGRRTVLARTTLTSAGEREVLAGIGYSDDVTVFVNGRPVYTGINGWASRGPGYASFVDARFESAWLPLRAGANEIVLAITDDQLVGWGFAVRIDPIDERP